MSVFMGPSRMVPLCKIAGTFSLFGFLLMPPSTSGLNSRLCPSEYAKGAVQSCIQIQVPCGNMVKPMKKLK